MNIKEYLPEHQHLTITHNKHKFYDETVEQFLRSEVFTFFSEQDKETAILKNELWTVCVYFSDWSNLRLAASDFEMLMKLSKEYK